MSDGWNYEMEWLIKALDDEDAERYRGNPVIERLRELRFNFSEARSSYHAELRQLLQDVAPELASLDQLERGK